MRQYLIPANSKKSLLIFSRFTPMDLCVFIAGVIVSFVLLLTLPVEDLLFAIIAIAPGCICSFLVFPIPNYHNVMTFIKIAYTFYTTRRRFVWRGWCFSSGINEKGTK